MISYARLFKLLEERNITVFVLRRDWGIASDTVQRLKKNETVETTALDKICNHLNCNIEDIMEHIPDNEG